MLPLLHVKLGAINNCVVDLCWTCLVTCLELPKISLLDFLYRDFMDQFEDSRRLGYTSENNSEARETSCVII